MRIIVADMYFHKKHKKLNVKIIKEISTFASTMVVNGGGYYSQSNLPGIDLLDSFYFLPRKIDKLRNIFILLHLIILSITLVVKKLKYDKIIFLSTNNICCHYALSLRLFKRGSVVVIHHYDIDRTIASLRESELFKKRMNEYDHIVFAEFIKEGMIKFLGTREDRIHIVPHPLFVSKENIYREIEKKNIIIGVGRNTDPIFLSNMVDIDKESGHKSLNHIQLRTNGTPYVGNNVELFNRQDISQDEFDELLYRAKACVVIYPKTYRYRYSGVIVDALSHGCVVICNQIPIGVYYKSICPKNCKIVKDAKELYDMAFVDIAEFDYNEFYKYLNENSNSVIREKLYEAIHK